MISLVRLFRYLEKKDGLYAGTAIIFIVLQVFLELRLPDYMATITTLIQTPGSAISEVLRSGIFMLLCALGSLLSALMTGYFVARIAAGLALRLREGVYEKVMDFTMEEIGHFSTASLITRSTNDITQVQMVVAIGLQASVRAPIMAVWAIIKIAGKNFAWTMVTAGAVCMLLMMLSIQFALVIPKFTKIQALTDHLNLVTRENLTGVRVVRAYNAEAYQENKFAQANNTLADTHLFTQRVMAIMSPGMSLIMISLTLAIYWVGIFLINAAALNMRVVLFSDMVVFTSYAMQVIMAFMMMTMTLIFLPRSAVSAKRINEVLMMTSKITDGTYTGDTGERGVITFKDVSFRYPDAADDILRHISFEARQGETVAIIGATGSGKSTLINLIPRFYDVSAGQVLVDGVDVRDYTQKSLREKIGYVSQRAFLFGGTVRSNVAYGEGDSQADVQDAIAIAQAEEFVSQMTQTYDAPIAQGGTNVSGGQKQRLSIARAVYRDPEIYIFDDAFSALDYKTDRALRRALKKKASGATMIIVAQRIGTIMDADRILVMDEGKIIGIGRHEELMRTCALYQEIAQSQLSKEELEHARA